MYDPCCYDPSEERWFRPLTLSFVALLILCWLQIYTAFFYFTWAHIPDWKYWLMRITQSAKYRFIQIVALHIQINAQRDLKNCSLNMYQTASQTTPICPSLLESCLCPQNWLHIPCLGPQHPLPLQAHPGSPKVKLHVMDQRQWRPPYCLCCWHHLRSG